MDRSYNAIDRRLTQIGRRQLLMHAVRDSALFIAGCALLLLTLAFIGDFVQRWRLTFDITIGTLALAALTLFVARLLLIVRQLKRPEQLARLTGRRRPALHSDLLSVVELQRERDGQAVPRFSTALFSALVQRTADALQAVHPRDVVPAHLLRPAAMMLALTAAAWALAGTIMPDRLGSAVHALFAFDVPRATIADAPLIADLHVKLTFPPHIGRASQVLSSSTGHITAPRGTTVELRARALLPVRRARLTFESTQGRRSQSPLSLDGDRQLAGKMVLTESGSYTFEVEASAGMTLRDPNDRKVVAVADLPPRVTAYVPTDRSPVGQRQQIELGIRADDDYGLRTIRLAHRVDQGPVVRSPLWQSASSASRVRHTVFKHLWRLAEIDLKPGSTIDYWIEATDNEGAQGKVGRSDTYSLSIFDPQATHRATLASLKMLLEAALRTLASRLLFETDITGLPLVPTLLSRTREAHKQSAQLLDGLRELNNKMRDDPLVPAAILGTATALTNLLQTAVDSEATTLRRLSERVPTTRLTLASIKQRRSELIEALEEVAFQLANLLDEQRLVGLAALRDLIDPARQRLHRLVEQYRRNKSAELRAQILKELATIERLVGQIAARSTQLEGAIPDEYLNAEALQRTGVEPLINGVRQALATNDLGRLSDLLKQLDSRFDQLSSALSENLQTFRSQRATERQRALSALLDDLRDFETRQRNLAQGSTRLIQRYRDRASALLKSQISPFIKKQLNVAQKLSKPIAELERAPLEQFQRQQLARISKRLAGLRGALQAGDIGEAVNMARRTEGALNALNDDIAETIEGRYGKERAALNQALRRATQALGMSKRIRVELESVFPKPRSLLEAADRNTLRKLAAEQRTLRGRLERATQRLKDPLPTKGDAMALELKKAAEMMDEAAQRLRAVEPQEAQGIQQAIAERLAKLQQQIRRANRPRLSRWTTQRRKIKIPGAEESVAPKEFRHDILEAMKEPPPEAFKDQVKRYYRELVR